MAALGAASGGCGGAAVLLFNQTASLGGSTVGDRGTVTVLLVNKTPYRAAFTLGTYDQTDRRSEPSFQSFGIGAADTSLEGDATTTVTLDCGRVAAIGSPALMDFIHQNIDEPGLADSGDIEGIEFFEQEEGGDEFTSRGFAPPLERLLGADFNCGSLLILTFDFDDVGAQPFLVDFAVVPARDTR
jgi:hypothetical protein